MEDIESAVGSLLEEEEDIIITEFSSTLRELESRSYFCWEKNFPDFVPAAS